MITVMFPSRGRERALRESADSLTARAADSIQLLVAIDPDEEYPEIPGIEYWRAPERYGYSRQQHYYNSMLPMIRGDWVMVWGDDARMLTPGWDRIISSHSPAVLHPASNAYPYCFPVFPSRWARELGRVTPSAHPDSYWYSVGKGLDLHREIPVCVDHQRFDLTGDHDDATYREGRGQLGQTGMADDGGGELCGRDIEVIGRLLCRGGPG